MDDICQSDQQSIDLDRMSNLPKPRMRVRADSDGGHSHISGINHRMSSHAKYGQHTSAKNARQQSFSVISQDYKVEGESLPNQDFVG